MFNNGFIKVLVNLERGFIMEFISISDYAKVKGISKQAVYRKLETSLKGYFHTINGKKCLSSDCLSPIEKENLHFIEQQLKVKNRTMVSGINDLRAENEKLKTENTILLNRVESLTNQIEELKRQYQEVQNNMFDLSMKMSEIAMESLKRKEGFFKRLFLPRNKE